MSTSKPRVVVPVKVSAVWEPLPGGRWHLLCVFSDPTTCLKLGPRDVVTSHEVFIEVPGGDQR